MEKPGLQTLSACWRAHGYLMGSRYVQKRRDAVVRNFPVVLPWLRA
jgi:hypothetical protein